MTTDVGDNKRIFRNTLFLYFRMLLLMAVNFYTIRVVLRVLGVEDYGIYNVTAGVAMSFIFISNTTSTAVQRFLSFCLGRNESKNFAEYFKCSKYIFYVIISIVIILGETVGLWIVCEQLVIPAHRLAAAVWVYQGGMLSIVCALLSVPYISSIISHEKMEIYAYISIADAILKLCTAFMLEIIVYDGLIVYTLLLSVNEVIRFSLYRYYALKHSPELKIRVKFQKGIVKKMLGFTQWNLFGSLSGLLRGQGLNILINIYFGPVFNTARGIAYQVYNAINSFCSNFIMAVNPQIIKLYAIDEKEKWMKLVCHSATLSYCLLGLLAFPVFVLMELVLKLWLPNAPEITVIFTRLVIVNMMIECLSNPLMTLNNATGKVKYYQLIVGTTLMLNLPASWIAFRMEAPAVTCFYIIIFFSIVSLLLRLLILKRTAGMDINYFIKHVLLRWCLFICLIAILWQIIVNSFASGVPLLISVVVVTICILPAILYFIIFTKGERQFLFSAIKTIQTKIKR